MKPEEALVIYQAGQKVVVSKLCELSATVTAQEKKNCLSAEELH